MTGPRSPGEWLRTGALLAGLLCAAAMIVVGCEASTRGTANVDSADAPVYRASVSSSVAASVSSSRSRESQRQVTVTRQAIHASCDALSLTSVDAIRAVNEYVRAYNAQADFRAKAPPAIDALNKTADTVAGSLSDPLSPELRNALNDWVNAARAVSSAVSDNVGMAAFNDAIHRMNDVKQVALKLCDAAY